MSKKLQQLRDVLTSYSAISDATWQQMLPLCQHAEFKKDEYLYPYGKLPNSFAFLNRGVARLFACDNNGQEYKKRFFCSGEFPGVMSALHQQKAQEQGVQCLQDCEVTLIGFKPFRQLLFANNELMQFQIKYLEQNWLLEKDQREVCLIQQDATQRYLLFLKQNSALSTQIPQYHLASHLGISPTQLSRIRKTLKSMNLFT
ncbi:hypothetical protein PSECIP111854_03012 [Pseudoalteromonas sp. CIP111854]|uniref:Cyclic nucleotide-binding domain-containing protein n=1 Tax=Pseudoalteromonas holothuriae TaxID=2963714 RepID=A0A9W4R0F3_9GAMM|nr:Crp/Fnr family transcriptional regulator [Pseudoalteromonas sp. CIP111854]CAH9062438.1 hypothetical protein PSECIP111854_03012 [Pseudoalteromonas sp. CIP111854]